VKAGGDRAAARQHEAAQLGQRLVPPVDLTFQRGDVARSITGCFGCRSPGSVARSLPRLKSSFWMRARTFASASGLGGAPGRRQLRARDADARGQLVDGSVRLDAQGVLADLLPAHQAGVAARRRPSCRCD
jgi:hypothetical protein